MEINDNEFLSIISDLTSNKLVKQMKEYRQHYDVSTYEHCLNVSYISYKICKTLRLDYVSMARGAMLHDLFLYDWRDKMHKKSLFDFHAFSHPHKALENAKKVCNLNAKETDIIEKHMWPVTFALPKCAESYIITIVDKYSTIVESIRYYEKKNSVVRAYTFSYLFTNIVRNFVYTM